MRLGIISDIHGNLEALRQVLADIDQSELNGVACLGDNIGYGPEPDEVVKLIRKRNIPSIMGNHELVVVDPRYLVEMNPMTRRSSVLTLDLLSRDTIDYIHGLRPSIKQGKNISLMWEVWDSPGMEITRQNMLFGIPVPKGLRLGLFLTTLL
jgi:predicted phosphodiesterase